MTKKQLQRDTWIQRQTEDKKQITERHDNKKHRITPNTPKWLQGDTKLLQRDTKWL